MALLKHLKHHFVLSWVINLQPFFMDTIRASDQSSRLTSLPSELLLHICDLLSPVDRVCFCLCNHRLHLLFTTTYQYSFLRRDNLSILKRLERDLPGIFACDKCNVLHRYNGSISHIKIDRLCVRKECLEDSSV